MCQRSVKRRNSIGQSRLSYHPCIQYVRLVYSQNDVFQFVIYPILVATTNHLRLAKQAEKKEREEESGRRKRKKIVKEEVKQKQQEKIKEQKK